MAEPRMQLSKIVLSAGFVICVGINVFGQQAPTKLNDQRIVDLTAMGVSEQEILRMIASAPKFDFDLLSESTDAMMKFGVSEDVIKAMAARESGQPFAPQIKLAQRPVPAVTSNNITVSTTPLSAGLSNTVAAFPDSIAEVGAYYQSGGQWIEMMPEVVNWQTGGVVKSAVTVGIVKGDVNGRLRFGRSRLSMPKPIRLLVYTPEGTQITEYQLIRLRTHSNAREFRTVTGGIWHVSGGSKRDDIPFEGQHIAVRTWTIALDSLQPGEYGLLPPGAIEARSASAQLGKMYTFTVTD